MSKWTKFFPLLSYVQPCQSSCTFIRHQGRLRSNNNGFPRPAGRTCRRGSEDVAAVSGNTRKPTGSCVRSPVCLWSVCSPGHTDEQELEQISPLWRPQSSVTDKAIMALPCAFKAIIKCDRVCPDATPTERVWGVYWQQIMTGEADGGDTHRIIAFSFQQQKKKEIWRAAPEQQPNKFCRCLQAKSGNFLWYMTHIGIGLFTFPGGGGRGKNVSNVEDLTQAAGQWKRQ